MAIAKKVAETDAALHAYFMERFPTIVGRIDSILESVFDIVSHRAFALIVALLLTALAATTKSAY